MHLKAKYDAYCEYMYFMTTSNDRKCFLNKKVWNMTIKYLISLCQHHIRISLSQKYALPLHEINPEAENVFTCLLLGHSLWTFYTRPLIGCSQWCKFLTPNLSPSPMETCLSAFLPFHLSTSMSEIVWTLSPFYISLSLICNSQVRWIELTVDSLLYSYFR